MEFKKVYIQKMQISNRLKLVISFVSPCGAVADIGTDHAYVPIELVKSGIVKRAYAMDIHTGPLERAEEHIKAEKLSEFIEVRQSDGLDNLGENEADSIIIAGMGGELTVNILERGKKILETVKELILSPHSEVFLVRKYLIKNGYEIVKEKMICDAGKYYTVIRAVKAHKSCEKEYEDEIYYLYGKLLIEERDSVLREYLVWKRRKKEQVLAGLEGHLGESARKRRSQIRLEADCIDRALRRMEGYDQKRLDIGGSIE